MNRSHLFYFPIISALIISVPAIACLSETYSKDSFVSNLALCLPSDYFSNCFGTKQVESGDKYVGEFKDGSFSGQGTYTYANGEKYVGEWKDGKEHGQGTLTFPSGDKYVG